MAEMMDFEEFKRRYQKVPVEEYPNRVREAVPDPLLTVHLITYNHADYIRKAIESVLMQEVDFPMEIVLGDDDSSDGTREICVEYANNHPDLIRLQLHHRENNHSLYGRPTQLFQYWYNTLVARGKYLAPLSGDDYWTDKKKLQQQVAFLEGNPRYSLTHHNAQVVDDIGRVKEESYFGEEEKRELDKEDLVRAPLVVASSALFQNVFSRVPNEFMCSFHEDRLVTSMMSKYGRGRYYHKKMCAYRKTGDGLYDSSKRKVKTKDKIKYINIIKNVICKEKKCVKIMAVEKAKVAKNRYIKSIKKGSYCSAIRHFMSASVKLSKSGNLKKLLSWFLLSFRYTLGLAKKRLKK